MPVASYLRVSSEDQEKRGTIENQDEFARKYAGLHGLEIAEWYRDDGVTGTIPLEDRPAGAQLLADAQAGKIDLLLIYRLDRLGRSARIVLNAVHDLEQAGVKIRSMTEPFDTGDPSGRFLLTILAGVADLERENILERFRLGSDRAARQGKWLGGIVPYGYRVNAGHLEICESLLPGMDMTEADVVRLIYRMVGEQGCSTVEVANYLNALGVPTAYVKDGRQVARGKRKTNTAGIWRPGRVYNMLVNTTYMGVHRYGKRTAKKREIIEREVPAIVSQELWHKTKQALRGNMIEATRNAKRQYLLRGLIKCGVCGLTYYGTQHPGPGRKPKPYYVCGGKNAYRGPLQGRCPSRNIPAQWIEGLVWWECLSFLRDPGPVLGELAAAMENQGSEAVALEQEREGVEQAVRQKGNERQAILDLYRRRLISDLDVECQLQKIAGEEHALQSHLEELDRAIIERAPRANPLGSAQELLAELRSKLAGELTFETRREIVKALVAEVRVETKMPEDGRRPRASVVVRYTFSGVAPRTLNHARNNIGIEHLFYL